MTQLIDLHHIGRPGVIAVYLLDGPEPALVDCGPAVCVEALDAGLAERGLTLADVRHVLLTHIHPDHAGAGGALVQRHPGLQIHVHEVGAPHLVDPARLDRSARRLYGEDFDRLFGAILPVPEENVHVLGGRALGLEVLPTPGHARHHVSFLDADGGCYAGDALGCLMPPGNFLYPASAPPEIDLEAWEGSFAALEERRPTLLRLPHFGEFADPGLIARARERLREWASRVERGQTVEEFWAAAEEELASEAPDSIERYRQMPGFELSHAGLKRYFDQRVERQAAGA